MTSFGSNRNAAHSLRTALLSSACAATFAISAPAFADTGAAFGPGLISQVSPEAQANLTSVQPEAQNYVTPTLPEAQTFLNIVAGPEPEIVIANPGTPTTARDTSVPGAGVNGIGQMIVDQQNGFIGLCTGTLINPRTVIFAAHCVNSRDATAYGAASGGTPIGFGFEANLRRNATGEVDELLQWYLAGANQYKTNVAQSFFNVNQVVYNPFSLEPDARSFLYGDVALATLDTPAAKVPTWALLFSPLPNPGAIGAAGTGYNVGIYGYGNNGNATTGSSGGIDFRRRAAENMIGALTDLDTFEGFLFGEPPSGLTQNLYFMDFDDPLRGLTGASPFDFNAFRDNARTKNGTPTEGITASGDSGGPLVLQNFTKQLVIGVLSGGYTRFFNGQPANGYGTVSFYQPLYLYWDWIAANNPYHYVSATAGNGSWTDPTHWVSTLDPSYYILSGGQPVNGLPTVAGEQKNGTSGDFGQACFQTTTLSDCLDLATGVETVNGNPIGTASNGAASVNGTTLSNGLATFDGVTLESQAGAALPAATLTNGLPGATNFVPNNADPIRATGTLAKYYDVTLSATGITTLSGADVTIDRLTIGTAGAGLVVASGASLTSLMGVNQFAGTVAVNGTLNSIGDYSLMGGGLSGTGRINTPFLTSILGGFAPGTIDTIGRLTIGGNLIMASGSNYLANLGAGNTSDRIVVVANGTSTGAANVGGTLNLSFVTGYRPADGDKFTVLSAAGGVTGTFATPGSITAILYPIVAYTATAVTVEIDARAYASVIDTRSPIQVAYAQLLDQNRSNYANLRSVFSELDLLTQAQIRANLEALAPRAPSMNVGAGIIVTDVLGRFFRDRLANASNGEMGGTVAMYGRPLQLAALSATDGTGAEVMSDVGTGMVDTGVTTDEDSALYLAAGYINGSGTGLTGAVPGGRNKFDGFYISGGFEHALNDTSFLGIAMSYADLDGTAPQSLTSTGNTLYQATIYGSAHLGATAMVDFQTSGGIYNFSTQRQVAVGGSAFTLTGSDEALAFTGELGLSAQAGTGSIDLTPRASIRYSTIGFDRLEETGGGPAMSFNLDTLQSWQARVGATAKTTMGNIRPYVSANYVLQLQGQPTSFGGNFALGTGPAALFGLGSRDSSWAEVAGGLTITGERVSASLSAETTVFRSDYKNQSYRASVTLRF